MRAHQPPPLRRPPKGHSHPWAIPNKGLADGKKSPTARYGGQVPAGGRQCRAEAKPRPAPGTGRTCHRTCRTCAPAARTCLRCPAPPRAPQPAHLRLARPGPLPRPLARAAPCAQPALGAARRPRAVAARAIAPPPLGGHNGAAAPCISLLNVSCLRKSAIDLESAKALITELSTSCT